MKNITQEWLEENKACYEGTKWFLRQGKREAIDVIRALVADNHWNWANWTLVRLLSRKQQLSYAIFAAELVLPIFEAEYPNDNRPRLAIEATRKCLEKDTKKNREEAFLAYSAASAAYRALPSSNVLLGFAIAAAYSAALAASSIIHSAVLATGSATCAVEADVRTKKEIIEYGISLIGRKRRKNRNG